MRKRGREPRHDGTFWGLKDGKVSAVQKWLESGGVYLTSMNEDAVEFRHHVMRGQVSSAEVVTVFGLTNITFVESVDCDTDREKAVREKLQRLAANKS